jgi:nucleotide-binding universal stress UspA family protein
MNDIAEFVIRRILVALDASTHSLAALEEAAALASAMQAELLGLFVEDINLVRGAGLPFARQVSYPSGAAERMTSERIDRELKAQAELARRALAAAAARQQARWSFRTVRGQVTGEILAAASHSDLVLLGKSGWSPARPVGSTARALIAASPGAFLLVPQEAPQAGPIAVFFEGSSDSRRALEAAIRLAIARQAPLLVLVSCASPDACDILMRNTRQIVGSRVKEFRIRRVQAATSRDLAQLLRTEHARLLVLPGGSALAQESGIRSLLELTRSPLLLIR